MNQQTRFVLISGGALLLLVVSVIHSPESAVSGSSVSEGAPARSPSSQQAPPRAQPAQVSVAPAQQVPAAVASSPYLTELNSIQNCMQDESCRELSQQDPKAAFYDGSYRAQKVLREAKLQTTLSEPQRRELALQGLKWPEDDVKRAALELLETLPPSAEDLGVLLDSMQEVRSRELIQEALLEMSRHQSPGERQAIDQFLIRTIQAGPMSVNHLYASEVGLLITDQNRPNFEVLLANLPVQSQRYRALKATLAEQARR